MSAVNTERPRRYAEACECECGKRYCAGNRDSRRSPARKHKGEGHTHLDQIYAARRKHERQAQAETVETAVRHYQTWTSWEIDLLARDDLSRKDVARITGRTLAAVGSAKKKLRRESSRQSRLEIGKKEE